MKKALFALAILALAGCADPYGPVEGTYNNPVLTPDPSKQQTKIKIFRATQFRDSLFKLCNFVVSVDGKPVARLPQNKYVTVYVDNGTHYLSYYYSCDTREHYAQKALEVIANGMPQEYSSRISGYGELQMWRTK